MCLGPAGTEPVSRRGLALFYLGSFRDEVGVGDSVQACMHDSYRVALQPIKAMLGNWGLGGMVGRGC